MPRKVSTVGSLAQGNHEQPNRNPSEKKKRTTRPAGCPDPSAEVVALRLEDPLATGRYICTVCGKGFQRDQNLQLHMRTHNINYELKKSDRTPARRKKSAHNIDGLRVENGSAIDFCLGSSFSLMNSTEKSAGFGSTNRSLTNMCLYGTGEKASVQANSIAKNDFLDNTSATLTETGQKSNPSIAIPMLGSLSFMNNNISRQFQALVISGSSSGSTLLQKAGLMNSTAIAPLPSYFSGLVMKTSTNLFQTQQQEHMLPPTPELSFLTSLPNLKSVPGNINSFSHHTQENDHSNLSRSAFSIYRPEYGDISSNNSPVTSYFRNFVDSTDSCLTMMITITHRP
ncbi:uncharacterized protein LOC122023027 [Zingiber officinale]|uniref:uncharacterized protein LOC122023027 n=1 Tax=Zingiber officinale TaxID=94328 RepID=UPI001C4BE7A1|nr:uncharacterized protein LOC122023027 [Zingiber officinale]